MEWGRGPDEPRKVVRLYVGDTTWMSDAACKDMDPDVFFPNTEEVTKQKYKERIEDAKEVCRPCPVRETCGEYALENGLEGIWGGMTERARKTEHTRRSREQRRRSRTLQVYRGTSDDPLVSWIRTIKDLSIDGEDTWKGQRFQI